MAIIGEPVELWDFGVAVDITPPGPGEVLAPAEAYRPAEQEPPFLEHAPATHRVYGLR